MFELRNIFSDIHEKWMHFLWASWGKVIFSEACIKNSVHIGWVSRQKLPPPPPGADTPQEQTPPCPDQTPLELCMLGDTGNKRVVRILLECILV